MEADCSLGRRLLRILFCGGLQAAVVVATVADFLGALAEGKARVKRLSGWELASVWLLSTGNKSLTTGFTDEVGNSGAGVMFGIVFRVVL